MIFQRLSHQANKRTPLTELGVAKLLLLTFGGVGLPTFLNKDKLLIRAKQNEITASGMSSRIAAKLDQKSNTICSYRMLTKVCPTQQICTWICAFFLNKTALEKKVRNLGPPFGLWADMKLSGYPRNQVLIRHAHSRRQHKLARHLMNIRIFRCKFYGPGLKIRWNYETP